MSTPLVGHLDPEFLQIMDETMALLRDVFQTRNRLTIPVSGTGSAGMEAALCNLIEDGDTVVIGVNGLFGERMCDVAERCRACVIRIDADWGKALDPEPFAKVLRENRIKITAVVHAETSTGVLQPLEEISKLTKAYGSLLLVDAVTSLGGVNLEVDGWGIDACYSGTQKCLSCPPGLAPITFHERAMEAVRQRSRKVQSWYLDFSMIERYLAGDRFYHHTAPITMIYALRESLRLIHEEGLPARFARHLKNSAALKAGLEALGLKLFADARHALPSLVTAWIPEGIDDLAVRRALLHEFDLEIGCGLGPVKGRIWRIGLMGYSSSEANVFLVLAALERLLNRQGFRCSGGVDAAMDVLQNF